MHPLIAYEWLFGLTEILHIIGFAIAIGSIGIVDLQLAGWGFRGTTAAALQRELDPWTKTGLALVTVSGLLILSTDGARYLTHPAMLAKLVLFALAIMFHFSWHTAAARGTFSATAARAFAATSVLLWTAVVFGGIFYAFT
jgi:hypothetical protein